MNISRENEHKLRELEDYLNSLLRTEAAVYSPALRALFQFDHLLRKKEKKRKGVGKNKGDAQAKFNSLYGGNKE